MEAVMEDYAKLYSKMHQSPKVFMGRSIRKCDAEIVKLMEETQPRSLIDYGCGKGLQYSELRLHERWGGLMPTLYDVGVPEFSKRPRGPFDGVICTDVMEHIAEPDVPVILADIFSLLPPRDDGGESMAFFSISTKPASHKRLPDGRNVHLCVKPPDWWHEQIGKLIPKHVLYLAKFEGDT